MLLLRCALFLSFRKREAQRNLLTAGAIGSRAGHRKDHSPTKSFKTVRNAKLSRQPMAPAVSRFHCAPRLGNDKRERLFGFKPLSGTPNTAVFPASRAQPKIHQPPINLIWDQCYSMEQTLRIE